MTNEERDAMIERIIADPEAFHRETVEELRKEHGDEWVREHAAELEAGWQAMKAQFGL